MVLAQVETRAERLPRTFPFRDEFAHADHERGGLTRHRQIAVDRADIGRLRARRILVQVLNRLLARPVLVVQAAVDDQAARAPQLAGEKPEFRIRILIEARDPCPAARRTAPSLPRRRCPATTRSPCAIAVWSGRREWSISACDGRECPRDTADLPIHTAAAPSCRTDSDTRCPGGCRRRIPPRRSPAARMPPCRPRFSRSAAAAARALRRRR